jgi:hypothetical protein
MSIAKRVFCAKALIIKNSYVTCPREFSARADQGEKARQAHHKDCGICFHKNFSVGFALKQCKALANGDGLRLSGKP